MYHSLLRGSTARLLRVWIEIIILLLIDGATAPTTAGVPQRRAVGPATEPMLPNMVSLMTLSIQRHESSNHAKQREQEFARAWIATGVLQQKRHVLPAQLQ
jgi:hypothetical protein